MNKYLKIWWRVLRMSVMRDVAYKIDFSLRFFTGILWVFLQTILIFFIYDLANVDLIGGYNREELFFVFALFQLVMSGAYLFTPGLVIRLILNQIHKGGLDFFLIKPVNTFLSVVFQQISLQEFLPNFVYALMLLLYLISLGSLNFDFIQWIQILFVLLCSLVLVNVIYWVSIFMAFFIERPTFLITAIDNLYSVAIYPRKIYPNWIRGVLVYLLPVLIFVNPVFSILSMTFGLDDLITMYAILFFWIIVLYFVWGMGLKRYNSAN